MALSGGFASFQESIWLLDANGRTWKTADASYSSMGGGGVSRLTYWCTFIRNRSTDPQIGEPAKLVWEIPLDTREIEVPVDLKNLPILPTPQLATGEK
jgi:hypothetical protein